MRADRLIAILLRLHHHGKMTTEALAKDLEVSRRTILRDIEALSSAGIPIYTDAGHHGGISLDENYRIKLTGLKEDEAKVLLLTGNESVLKDIGLGSAAKESNLKLFAALPPFQKDSAKFLQERIYIDPVWWWYGYQSLTFIDALYQAVINENYLEVLYEKRNGDVQTYHLAPYGMVAKSSMWYLVAAHETKVKIFRVSRFHKVDILNEWIARPNDFDLKSYWDKQAKTFMEMLLDYHCVLRIQKIKFNFVRWYAAGLWEILEEDENHFLARFEFESIELAKMLVFGLGKDVQIIEPKSLEEAFHEHIKMTQSDMP